MRERFDLIQGGARPVYGHWPSVECCIADPDDAAALIAAPLLQRSKCREPIALKHGARVRAC
jgi:hypothetical protein